MRAGQRHPEKSHNVVLWNMKQWQFSQQQSVILSLEDKCIINYAKCDGEVKRSAEQEVWCLIHHIHSLALQMKCFATTNCESVAFQLCLKVPSPARAPPLNVNIRLAFLKNSYTCSVGGTTSYKQRVRVGKARMLTVTSVPVLSCWRYTSRKC